MTTAIASTLLKRFVRPDEPDLSPEMARHILGFELSDGERSRLASLADKSNDGILTPDERSEYESLVLLGELLTLMKLKARIYLEHRAPAA